jgi:hypothetical protein
VRESEIITKKIYPKSNAAEVGNILAKQLQKKNKELKDRTR